MLRKALLELCVVVNVCASVLSFGAEAQSPSKIYRVGWLTPQAYLPNQPANNRGTFIRAMSDLGYVEGRNLVIDSRSSGGKNELLPGLAAELVALKPDVIVAVTTPATDIVRQATTTIPIVIVQVSDPVGSGFVTSLAHPGGNITGITDFGIDLAAKYVELAHAILPQATRIGVLMADNSIHPAQLKLTQDAAASIGLTVLPTMDRSDVELEQGFAALTKEKADVLIVLGGSPMGPQAERIAQLAEQAKLPTLYPDRYYVTRGGLLSYGPSYRDMYITAAAIVNKILNGANPADLPIEQPARFELVINLKKAEALHLVIPRLIRLRADELIQ